MFSKWLLKEPVKHTSGGQSNNEVIETIRKDEKNLVLYIKFVWDT